VETLSLPVFSFSMPAGQVEMKRVGIPAHVPCAVQQWEGLIAGALPLQILIASCNISNEFSIYLQITKLHTENAAVSLGCLCAANNNLLLSALKSSSKNTLDTR